MTRQNRRADQFRSVNIIKDFCPEADGSLIFEMGSTRVICAASVSNLVPDHAKEKGLGWVTAEYSLMPYSTRPRTERKLLRPDGRSVEIQRLVGRSLRSIVNLSALEGFAVTVDCDVIQADGGTRAASITGGFIALRMAVEKLLKSGALKKNPITANVAAISAGYVDNKLLLDLEYQEDSKAQVDMNIVMDSKLNFVEIQGTGERLSFTREQFNNMISLAENGIKELFEIQNNTAISS